MQNGSRTGPKLPSDLLERIQERDNTNQHRPKRGLNRKDVRRQKRDSKKERKASHHMSWNLKDGILHPHKEARNPPVAQTRKRSSPVPVEAEGARKRRRVFSKDNPKLITSSGVQSHTRLDQGDAVIPKSTKNLTIDDLTKPTKTSVEANEAKEIAWLENQLGVSRKSSKSSAAKYGAEFADDGLEDLLLDVDRILGGTRTAYSIPESAVEGSSDIEESFGDSSESPEGSNVDPEDDVEIEDKNHTDPTRKPASQPIKTELTSRYIPPHLRALKASAPVDSPGNFKLQRLIKGLLNKMSEQNIESLLDEVLSLYRSNPRNDVTTALTSQIVEGISSHSSLIDSYVILHGTLVASLHKLVGVDFAAHFVEICVAKYEEQYSSASAQIPVTTTADTGEAPFDVQGKECNNLMVLIAELYNFQVISCVLVYDLIRKLLFGALTELNVELILKIARNSGPQLRQDDPLALKDIVQLVQAKVSDKNPRDLSSRIRFMVETLGNLKNNKIRSSTSQAPGSDSVSRLRKFLNGLSKKHHVITHEPLNVSLEDLHAADKKGKWWLVGSAWSGDPLVDVQKTEVSTPQAPSTESSAEDALFKLARKQGMNTEVRRSIFVVLMSSEDYVDACERLGQLSLNEVQRREIGRVLVHCCSNEKTYNPYYTMVGQRLCNESHSFKVTLQYCLWDFLREIGETEVGGAAMVANSEEATSRFDKGSMTSASLSSKAKNVAHAFAWWVAKGSISLGALKGVPFEGLREHGHSFFEAFFAQLIIGSQTSSPLHSIQTLNPTGTLPFTNDRNTIESLFLKAASQHATMAAGIYKLLSAIRWERLSRSHIVVNFLNWGGDIIKETIRNGLDI